MKTLSELSHNFNLDPPSYREVTNVIMRTKSRASPCALDQISVIPLKKCPYLGTFLWRIISSAWTRTEFAKAMKQGITILAYKKGFGTDPANFRPITLQSSHPSSEIDFITLKISTSKVTFKRDFGTISRAAMKTLKLSPMSSIMLARNNVIL